LDDAPACPACGSINISFVAPDIPGSYVFYDNRNGLLGRAMGLAGALIVRPRDGVNRLYDGGPGFNREHLAVFQEVDSRLNLTIDNGGAYDMKNFEPNFFFVNNVAYVRGGGVEFLLGLEENVAIRFVNAGLIYYPMHFHGYHVNVVTRNRVPETFVIEKDTVSIRPGEVVEVILPVGLQAGLYPLHSHYVPAVTNNGTYAGGGLIMLNAS
jgi:FtsP/CotA-like multicopper oxidase with cupredoxin domain